MNWDELLEELQAELSGELRLGQDMAIPLKKLRHLHIVGSSGMGKSRLVQLICQQIVTHPDQPALVLIDPPGHLADAIFAFCAANQLTDRLILFDPTMQPVIGYDPTQMPVSNFVLSILKAWKQFGTEHTPRLRRVLTSLAVALKESGLTLAEAPLLLELQESPARSAVLERISSPTAHAELAAIEKMNLRDRTAQLESTLSRIRAFVDEERVRPIVTRQQQTLDLAEVIARGKIVLAPLRMPAALTSEAGYLLGSLLVSDVIQTAFRLDGAHPAFLVVDEFSEFATPDFSFLLDQARKVNLKCVLAHQHLAQVKEEDPKVYSAALTNPSHHLVMGGLSAADLEILASEFFLDEWDLDERKLELYRTYFHPHETRRTVSGYSHGRGSGQSDASGSTFGVNEGLWGLEEEIRGVYEASGSSESEFEGFSETEVPFHELEERQELASVQFRSPEEQKLRSMALLKKLGRREFALKVKGGKTQIGSTLKVPDTHLLEAYRAEAKRTVLQDNNCYATLKEIESEEQERLRRLYQTAAQAETGDNDDEPERFSV